MSERYSNVFTLPQNLYAVGSPIMIAAGTLLKDNQTGRIVAQLKFRSISDKIIKAVKVRLDLFDTAGNSLGESMEYDYLDLSASRDAEFGQKTPVPVPDNKARSYKVAVTEVVFADRSMWTANDESWEALGKPSLLPIEDSELLKQYQMCFGYNCKYAVREEKDLWYCSCGTWNHKGEACHVCRNSLSALQNVDMEELTAAKEERVAAEEKQKAVEKQKRTTQRKKLLVIGATVFAIIIAIISVITSPKYIWKQTIKEGFEHYANGDFSEAEVVWARAGKEPGERRKLFDTVATPSYVSSDMRKNGYKPTAEEFLEYGENLLYEYAGYVSYRSFTEAVPLYEMIPDYKDSAAIAGEMQIMLDVHVGEYVCVSKTHLTHYGTTENMDLDDNVLIFDLRYDENSAGKINVLQSLDEQYSIFTSTIDPFGVHKKDGYALHYLDDEDEDDFIIKYYLDGAEITEDFIFDGGGEIKTIWQKIT